MPTAAWMLDPAETSRVFAERHHVVVANPPYIVPPTAEAREAYRVRYESATMKFGLGVPFTERLFELAVPGGFIAQITSNAFMKREHGKTLVEKVLPRFDLTYVLDTSGAFIPGHGTPTVILAARNRPPASDHVRAVLGKRGEPSTPEDASPIASLSAKRLARALDDAAEALAPGARLEAAKVAQRFAGLWVVTAALVEAIRWRAEPRREPMPGPDASLRETCCWCAGALPGLGWLDPDGGENPAWSHPLPRTAERALVAAVRLALPDPTTDSDWIGDMHQALDEGTRKRFAFCQTPDFVRDLLLDLSLTPALGEFGREGLRVIDPACGSGHLLLGAFWRLFHAHAEGDDGAPEYTYPECARRALDALHGGDLNPEVVSLAAARLVLAYLDASGLAGFRHVPDDLPIHLVSADALLAHRPVPSKPKPVRKAPAPKNAPHQGTLFG